MTYLLRRLTLTLAACLVLLSVVLHAAPATLTQSVTYSGETITMQLTKQDLRGPNFELWAQNASGSYDVITPVEERAYIGTVDEYPSAISSGILKDNGQFQGAVYFDRGGTWFTLGSSVTETRALTQPSIYYYPTFTVSAGHAGTNTYRFDVGVDADYDYYSSRAGGSVAKAFEMIEYSVATTRALYMQNVLLRPYLGRVIIRTDQAQDPADGLTGVDYLNAVKNEWNTNQTDADRDVVSGVTKSDVGGGFAYIGSIAEIWGYSVNDSWTNGDFGNLWRHELGHNWGMGHYDGGTSDFKPEGPTINSGNTYARMSGPEAEKALNERDEKLAYLDNESTYTGANIPPYAAMDAVTFSSGVDAQFNIDVMANDHDANGDALSILSFDAVSDQGGTITQSGSGSSATLVYSPPSAYYVGSDWFYYEIQDASGQTATGVVTVIGQLYTVPNVVGSTKAAAEAAIVAASLTVGNVTSAYSPTVPVGDVISQNPAGGVNVAAGSTVDIVVSAVMWDGEAGDNNWFTASNWDPDVNPTWLASIDLSVNGGTVNALGQYYQGLDGGGSLTIDGGDVTWESRYSYIGKDAGGTNVLMINGGTFTNRVNPSYPNSGGKLNIGDRGDGILIQTGGILNTGTVNDWSEIGLGGGGATGRYQISGGTVNAGKIKNGWDGPGTVHIIGDAADINLSGVYDGSCYYQHGNSKLKLDIGSGISVIDATAGSVELHGTLEVEFTATPSVGDTFDIIQYGSLSGTFDTFDTVVDSPNGADTVTLAINYGVNGNTIQLSVVSVSERLYTVPDVVGYTQAAAEAAIVAASLTVGNVTNVYSPTVPAGDVISQNPAGGVNVAAGSTVDIVVSAVMWDGEAGDNNWFTASNWNPDQDIAREFDQHLTVSTNSTVNASEYWMQIVGGGSLTIDHADAVVTWDARFGYIGGNDAGAGSGTLYLHAGTFNMNYSGTQPYAKIELGNRDAGLIRQTGGTLNAIGNSPQINLSGGGGGGVYEISGGTLNTGKLQNGWTGGGTVHIIGDDATINLTGTSSYYSQNYQENNPSNDLAPSTLKLDIGSGISMINAAGSVQLGGILDVAFTETPLVGDTFDIIQYGSLSGTFDTFDTLVNSPAGADTVTLGIDYGVNGDTVQLSVVSVSGPSRTVPNVVGSTQAAAEAAIVAASLTVGNVTTAYSSTVPAGDVISQTPSGGASVIQGTPVDIVVSLGIPADIDGDGDVDVVDLGEMAGDWLQDSDRADIYPHPDGDNIVDFRDFAFFAQYWLEGVNP